MPVINKHALFKELSNREIKKLKKPWVIKGIATAINKRNSFLKKFLKTKDQFWFIRYKNHRAKINHLLRKSKKNHYNQLYSKSNNDMKKTWKEINKIIHKNKTRDTILCVTTEKGVESNPYKIANKFNDFYTTISTKLVTKIKTNKSFDKFLDPKQQNTMFLSPVTIEELELCIKELDSKKASDIYGMSENS